MHYNEFLEAVENKSLRLSYSSLKNLLDSPKHFLDYFTKPRKESEAMKIGTLVHCLILEPNEVQNRYAVADKPDKRTKVGKEEWSNILAANDGKVLVSLDIYQQAESMANAVKSHYEFDLFEDITEFEKTFAIDYRGHKIQGIVDALGSVIIDLKTTANAAPKKFKWSFFDFRYHVQAAIYTLAFPNRPYYIFAVDANCHVSVHEVSPETIEIGRQLFDQALDQYEACEFVEKWDMSYDGINIL